MTSVHLPRLMLSAARSGAGKTTVTCAVLQALKNRGVAVSSYKCGPDYIDPMFHTTVLGLPARNLDPFFTDENTTRFLLGRHANSCDVAIIEGVMGHYDGIAGTTTQASAYALSKMMDAPTVLIADCKGTSVSIAAELLGFLRFRPDAKIQGVILNRISPMLYPSLKLMLERELDIRVLGYLPPTPDCSLESRHLGLITASEVENLREKLHRLAEQAERTIDLDGLLQLAAEAPPLSYTALALPTVTAHPTIAVARDRAFCFTYADNLDLLRSLGANLIEFSPLNDETLPAEADGLLLSGGYPELYAEALSANESMRASIRTALHCSLPCIAECGGFLYLHRTLQTKDGHTYPMVGALDTDAHDTGRLCRFGYITLTAEQDTLLCSQGEQIRAHEFHYYDSTDNGAAFTAKKPVRGTEWPCIHAQANLFAGYPHLYFYANPAFAERFVQQCAQYHQRKKQSR